MMGISVGRKDWLFLLVCIGLGVLADVTFLRGEIGVSYLVFITAFYAVVFMRFGLVLQHRRIGILLMAAIWLLSSTFVLYDVLLFKMINVLFIPLLVFVHLVLITRPNTFVWETPRFVQILLFKFGRSVVYVKDFWMALFYGLTRDRNPAKVQVAKQVFIGLLIGLPLLLVILVLLMAADDVFLHAMLRLPRFMYQVDLAMWIFRFSFVVFTSMLFFGVLQLLASERGQHEKMLVHTVKRAPFQFQPVMVLTVLTLMIAVYGLFFGVKFSYLFNDSLAGGFTYAQYARRGFYELLAVVLINWSVLLATLGRTRAGGPLLKVAFSLIIVVSGVLLVSSFGRLSLYESAYGFTVDRFLAHAFMVFLFVIFAYTFIRVWLERLKLLHFYLIVGLIFYVGLNMFNMHDFIIEKNLSRYSDGKELDVAYLSQLGYAGGIALLELAEKEPDFEELQIEVALMPCLVHVNKEKRWQAYNFVREDFFDLYEKRFGNEVDEDACRDDYWNDWENRGNWEGEW